MISFETRDAITLNSAGQKLFGILHLPLSQARSPAVLLCHGFGGNKSGKYRLFVRLSEELAKAGIASFRFDFRGAGDSEGSFDKTTIQSLLEDADVAYQFLANQSAIDPQRLGILGRSLGGMIAVAFAAKYANFRAMALWAPVFDAKPWLTKRKDGIYGFVHLGTKMGDDFVRQIEAIDTHVLLEKLTSCPLLHIHAKMDQSVDIYHLTEYEKARNKSKDVTKFVTLEKSDHEFSDTAEQMITLNETVAHFKRYLC